MLTRPRTPNAAESEGQTERTMTFAALTLSPIRRRTEAWLLALGHGGQMCARNAQQPEDDPQKLFTEACLHGLRASPTPAASPASARA
ncbi:hypothetical protein ACFTXM_18190 [Streptomyces sp. NPDC056930]|uniref:hypothetical protein n=1 Tax=Streptomyces sp. NPDC056930 TaxID=3345967 RepID=UPI00364518AD